MELSYKSWCSLSDDELAKRDIAEVNLFGAYNLPFAGKLDIAALQKQLDDWADMVDDRTRHAWKRRTRRERVEFTDDQFRILVMISVLQRGLGVKYNFAFIEGEYDAIDSRNLFVHGILTGHGGTCATMPVLYTAIGRRLRYPIWLVHAKEHTFCRWDDGNGERFNIEATSPGFNSRPDDYYLTWPVPIKPEELERGKYLHNMTPREELAFFLGQRGNCWFDNLKAFWAAEAYYHAHQLVPEDDGYYWQWGQAVILHRAVECIRKQADINPWSKTLCMPAPKEDWEKRLYPHLHKHLLRILDNHRARKHKATHQEALQDLLADPIQT